MNDPVKTFLEGVTAAYQRAPIEIVLIITLITAFVAGALIYAVVERRRHLYQAEFKSETLFKRRVAELDLAPSQVAVLRAMTDQMPQPREPHKLFEDEALFDRYLKRTYAGDKLPDDTVAVLRLACGFRSRGLSRGIRSTAHLSEGTTVFLHTPGSAGRAGHAGRERLQGIVERVTRPGLLVRVGTRFAPPAPGTAVEMFLHHGRGILSVKTAVLRSGRRRLLLQHKEGIKAAQRRTHFRGQAALPVTLFEDGTPTARGITKDVGGGGFSATFVGTEAGHAGAKGTRTAFSLGMRPAVNGLARVAHVDTDGLVRFEFVRVAEADRDRIYKELFHRLGTRTDSNQNRV